jgi:hypothetical protein
MLTLPLVGQSVQAIAGGHSQIGQVHGRIDPLQPAESALLDFGRQLPAAPAIPDYFCFVVVEAADHGGPFHHEGYRSQNSDFTAVSTGGGPSAVRLFARHPGLDPGSMNIAADSSYRRAHGFRPSPE